MPIGLAAGLLAWLAGGGPSASTDRLETVEAKVVGLRGPRPGRFLGTDVGVAQLAATPLFALTVGPGAVPRPTLRLDGVVKSRARTAALIAIDDQQPDWLALGESRGGVTLLEVTASKAVVETLYGPQEVALGQRSGGSEPAPMSGAGAPPAVTPTQTDAVPPGFRSPPPPASAPGPR